MGSVVSQSPSLFRPPGHYTGTDQSFLTLPGFFPPGNGTTQSQVAP